MFWEEIYDNIKGNTTDTQITKKRSDDGNGNITVNYKRTQYSTNQQKYIQESTFTYNIENLKNHIINNGIDRQGNTIKYFETVPAIELIPDNEKSEDQKKLLEELNNLVNYIIEAGEEYGIDPKQILAIIQEEVGFDGLGKRQNVTGNNGKGYMQITTIAIADRLNCTKYTNGINSANFAKGLKIELYGTEIIELFKEHGFNIENANTIEEKRTLLRNIMKYLTENKDPKFNIKLGTILLRQKLNHSKGDFAQATKNYNGHPKHKESYSRRTSQYLDTIATNCPQDSIYNYRKETLP